jgi:hypothetical protein
MPEGLTEEQTENLAAALKQVDTFAELRDADLRALVRIAQIEKYAAGAELYRQSDVDNVLYVILDGQASLFRIDPAGVESFIGFRGPGPTGWLGEASVLLGDAHDVTAFAYTELAVLKIERKPLLELLDEDPGLRSRLTPKPENADRLNAPRFNWQGADESVIKFVREHPWALYRRMIIPAAALFALLIAAVLIGSLISILSIILLVLAGLVFIGIGVYVFIDWHDDFYVVTNKRVVHVDQIPGIRQKLEEAPLSTIQEIQFARNSITAHVLNFGDLRVETFGGSVAMKDVPQPEELKSLIFREIEKVRSRARAAARKAIRDELDRRVGQQAHTPAPAAAAPVEEAQPATSLRSILAGVFRYFFPKLREESGDSVIYRKHWVALIRKTRLPFIGLFATLLAALIWMDPRSLLGRILPDSFWIAWIILALVFGAWSWWLFEDWRNDLYIVTATRIIDLQRVPFLLQETRKESGLDKVQTLEASVPTPWARLWRYGNVTIRVPGTAYEFKDVQFPHAVQREISKRVDQFKRRQAENEARGRRAELSDWFAVYDNIRTGYTAPAETPASSEKEPDGAA